MSHFLLRIVVFTYLVTDAAVATKRKETIDPGCLSDLFALSDEGGALLHATKRGSYRRAKLPPVVRLGAAVVHRIHWKNRFLRTRSPRTLFAYMPIPGAYGGKLMDLNALRPGEPLPQKFIIGDGSTRRALLGVDRTPGSPLSIHLDRIKNQINQKTALSAYPATLLELLKQYGDNNIGLVEGDDNSGIAQLPWDKAIPYSGSSHINLKEQPGDHPPVETGFWVPVVPLEHYLQMAQGYCLQREVLAILIARMFGVSSRLVAGAMASMDDPELTKMPGHFWSLLEDGQILDSTERLLEYPVNFGDDKWGSTYPKHIYQNDWLGIPTLLLAAAGAPSEIALYPWRFEYDRYFILNLDV